MVRDFVGYASQTPSFRWPSNSKLAISLAINFEEGAEASVEEGADHPEAFGEAIYQMKGKIRDLGNESVYEYGSRVGFWRLVDMLDKFGVKATFFACAVALEKNPLAAREITKRGHEVCSHGYRWDEHFYMTKDDERNSIRKALASLERTTGERPRGWYCRYAPSIYTRELLSEEGLTYDSDAYNDDIPYYVKVNGKDRLVVPYALDTNDFQFWLNRYASGQDFYQYLKDSLDYLYEESEKSSKMMSVGLHLRIVGRPGRSAALSKFLSYAKSLSGVWFARRIDIAEWWLNNMPPTRD